MVKNVVLHIHSHGRSTFHSCIEISFSLVKHLKFSILLLFSEFATACLLVKYLHLYTCVLLQLLVQSRYHHSHHASVGCHYLSELVS